MEPSNFSAEVPKTPLPGLPASSDPAPTSPTGPPESLPEPLRRHLCHYSDETFTYGHNARRHERFNCYRNERAGETGDPRQNPPTSGIVRPLSPLVKIQSEPGRDWNRFALVEGVQSNRSVTAAPGLQRFGRLLTAMSCESMRVVEVNMEQRQNEGARKTGDPREKTRRPAASSGTIPICENPPGSPWWEASVLIAQPPRPLSLYLVEPAGVPCTYQPRPLPKSGGRWRVTLTERQGDERLVRVRLQLQVLHDGPDRVVSGPRHAGTTHIPARPCVSSGLHSPVAAAADAAVLRARDLASSGASCLIYTHTHTAPPPLRPSCTIPACQTTCRCSFQREQPIVTSNPLAAPKYLEIVLSYVSTVSAWRASSVRLRHMQLVDTQYVYFAFGNVCDKFSNMSAGMSLQHSRLSRLIRDVVEVLCDVSPRVGAGIVSITVVVTISNCHVPTLNMVPEAVVVGDYRRSDTPILRSFDDDGRGNMTRPTLC
ncbi:hypothetical protein PR048_031060 [Dryococelus australis]|uniref:Uncharacterized protein n=1 Tax=Dryococelus australis TaxID=614101 RepID=A0ABQ9G463_9NEOP|nr:hypothetical protein PR048_031060 [Dryococelus australis]